MAALREWLGTVEAEGSSGRQGNSGVEVVVSSDPAPPAPLCPHGGSASGLSLAVGSQGAWVSLNVPWAFRALGFRSTPPPPLPPSVISRKRSFLGKLWFSTYLRNRHRKSPLLWFWLYGCYMFFERTRQRLGKKDMGY